MVTLIKQVHREPVERDTLYGEIKNYGNIGVQELETNPEYN